jgi:NADPH2:quinone reductase
VRAAVLTEIGGPFELRDVPDAVVGEGKVLVRVRAAGINFADVLIRRGRYPQMPELPAVLGSEIAGELEDGTRVMAFTSGGGGYAELAAVDRAQIVLLPDTASFAEGASFLLTFLTAYIPLTRQVRVRSGSTVLVYAAAGGVGTATIQVARALGARVVAAAGSAEKLDVCRELGADEAYVYDELPDDLQVDVVVDPVGGELFAGSFARLKPLGAVVAIGSSAGAWTEIDPEVVGTAVGELLGLWQTGALRPLVGAELPLDEVEQAHALVESRKSVGKVVLTP